MVEIPVRNRDRLLSTDGCDEGPFRRILRHFSRSSGFPVQTVHGDMAVGRVAAMRGIFCLIFEAFSHSVQLDVECRVAGTLGV